jgi:hypothetical protein
MTAPDYRTVMVVAVLVALQVDIDHRPSTIDRANIYASLQAASDEVCNGERMSSTVGRAAVISRYDGFVDAPLAQMEFGNVTATAVQELLLGLPRARSQRLP